MTENISGSELKEVLLSAVTELTEEQEANWRTLDSDYEIILKKMKEAIEEVDWGNEVFPVILIWMSDLISTLFPEKETPEAKRRLVPVITKLNYKLEMYGYELRRPEAYQILPIRKNKH